MGKKHGVEFLEIDAESILLRVRDCVHLGARLLSHPLSGGVLPGVGPYKSLIISEIDGSAEIDLLSLNLIENAIRLLQKTPIGFEGYDDKTLEDFMELDLDLLESAMSSIS